MYDQKEPTGSTKYPEHFGFSKIGVPPPACVVPGFAVPGGGGGGYRKAKPPGAGETRLAASLAGLGDPRRAASELGSRDAISAPERKDGGTVDDDKAEGFVDEDPLSILSESDGVSN